MIRVGLTGSIGMGKSTSGKLFAEAGIPVNDADAVVHDLYNGEAVPLVEAAFPGTTKDGAVDRQELGRKLAADPSGFKRLEAIVHPLVRQRERTFLDHQRAAGADIVVLDIPLLFETGADERVDKIVVVSCDPQIQRQRMILVSRSRRVCSSRMRLTISAAVCAHSPKRTNVSAKALSVCIGT